MRGTLGGTCLNVGCIPSKSLLNNSHLYHQIKNDTAKRGINVSDVKVDVGKLQECKRDTVKALTNGVEILFKKYGVKYYKGKGEFVNEHEVQVNKVDSIDGSEEASLEAENIIIATGSEATPFPGIEIDEERIITSTGALDLKEVPKRMVIIGGGIIGLEMGSVWNRLGSEVTVLEYANAIGAGMDAEVAKSTQKILTKQGFKIKTGAKVTGAERNGDVVNVDYEVLKNGKKESIEADVLLVAIGRRPYTEGLGLENLGENVEIDKRGRVVMDDEYKTKLSNIRVIGDVTFGPMLAHKAEDEGIAAVEYIKNGYGHVNYDCIPSVMYTFPEVAWVGQTEEEVKASGIAYNVGRFPFLANSRAKTNLETDGFVKFVTDKATNRVLGVHIIGPNAGEMIAEGALAVEYGASAEDVGRTCHAHPTLSEAFKEAAMDSYDKPINF